MTDSMEKLRCGTYTRPFYRAQCLLVRQWADASKYKIHQCTRPNILFSYYNKKTKNFIFCQRNRCCLQKVEILESNCRSSVNFLRSHSLAVKFESQIVAVFVAASNELWCWRWWQTISKKSFIFWDMTCSHIEFNRYFGRKVASIFNVIE